MDTKSLALAITFALFLIILSLYINPYIIKEKLRYEVKGNDITFYNSKEERIVAVEFSSSNNINEKLIPVRITLWHKEDTILKSFKIIMMHNGLGIIDAWLKVPDGYPWNPIHIYKYDRKVIVNASNLGFIGSDSLSFNLLIRPIANIKEGSNVLLNLEISLRDDNNHFIIKEYIGKASLEIKL